MTEKDLSRSEKAVLRDLILKTPGCANCDKQSGECLCLETRCPMLDLQFSGATLCTYFKAAVLPEDATLAAVFGGTTAGPLKTCTVCHRRFQPVNNRQIYCSEKCRLAAQREAARNRKRKQRLNVTV